MSSKSESIYRNETYYTVFLKNCLEDSRLTTPNLTSKLPTREIKQACRNRESPEKKMEIWVKFGSHNTSILDSSTVLNPGLSTPRTALGEAFPFCVKTLLTQNEPGVWRLGHLVSASDTIFKSVLLWAFLITCCLWHPPERQKSEIYRLTSTSSDAAYLT